ncbi:restriction endonuclease subunit S [Aerococcus viridans]
MGINKDSQKAPILRFKGFTDDWEQRKLSSMTMYKNGKSHEDKQSTSGKYELINLNSISISGGLKHSGKFIEDTDDTLQKDDLVMILSDIGHGDLLGRVALIPNDNMFVLNQRVALLRPNETADPHFLFSYINAHQYYFKSQGAGMSQLNISKGSVENFTSNVPTIQEQNYIGSFLKQINNIIALHQRKLDQLNQLKEALLQQMFPVKGETVPKLRFAGFEGDWEERKLGELSNIVGGGTPSTSNPEYWDGDIDWYAPAEIGEQSYVSKSKKTITELGLKKSSARILPVGTVLFTSRAGIGNTAILAKDATTNQGFQSIVPDKKKLDSYFIFSRTNELKRYGEVTGAGSTFVEVSGKQMSKMPIKVPVLSEQQRIGTFFKSLDDTITLQQRKLDQLKNTKQVLLQNMFI